MRIRTAGCYAVSVAAAIATLAGCSGSPGSQSAFAPTGPSAAAPSQPSHLTGVGKVVHVPVLVNGKLERRDLKLTPHTIAVLNYLLGRKSTPNAVRPGHHAGFIKPGFKVGALAYVTDPGPFPTSTGNVYVYSWYNPGKFRRGHFLGDLAFALLCTHRSVLAVTSTNMFGSPTPPHRQSGSISATRFSRSTFCRIQTTYP
jgi:hypothetical protein